MNNRWTEPLYGVYPAVVTDSLDPDGMGRVEIRLPWGPEPTPRIWARVAVLAAGPDSGTWFIPAVGDEVLVAFEGGNPSTPYVVGSLWNGNDAPPVSMDPSNSTRTITTPSGSRLIFRDDPEKGIGTVELETPSGQSVMLDDQKGMVTVRDGNGNSIVMDSSGIRLEGGAKITLNAPEIDITAGKVNVDSGIADFSGSVNCSTLVTDAVIASSYTPGAGNIH